MADLPIVPDRFKLDRPRRALAQADVGGHQTARPRGHRGGRQRLRRRPRGRADLRLPVREGQGQEARQAAVAELDDQRGHEGGARVAAPGRGVRAARAGRALALGGRLDRRHERHPRRDDPAAQLLRRRGLAGTRADARRSRSSPAARRRSGPSSPSPTGSSTRPSRADPLEDERPASAPTSATIHAPRRRCRQDAKGPRIATEEEALGDRRGLRGPAGDDHQAREERAARESADALRPDDAAARGQQPLRLLAPSGRSPPPSACTRSTRRSPIRARTRAT